MTRVTIDLEILRATMPKHPTWPTPGDTTDPKEADAVFASLVMCWILGAQAGDQPLGGDRINLDALRSSVDLLHQFPHCGSPECSDCWEDTMEWLETGLCAPESDENRSHGATVPPKPETGTQRPWPPPTTPRVVPSPARCLIHCDALYDCPHKGHRELAK